MAPRAAASKRGWGVPAAARSPALDLDTYPKPASRYLQRRDIDRAIAAVNGYQRGCDEACVIQQTMRSVREQQRAVTDLCLSGHGHQRLAQLHHDKHGIMRAAQ